MESTYCGDFNYSLYDKDSKWYRPPKGVLDRRVASVGPGDPEWYQGYCYLVIDRRATCWLWRFKMGYMVVLKGKVVADTFEEAEALIRSSIRKSFQGLGI